MKRILVVVHVMVGLAVVAADGTGAMGIGTVPVATNAVVPAALLRPPRIESRAFELVYAAAEEVANVINTTWRGNASPAWGGLAGGRSDAGCEHGCRDGAVADPRVVRDPDQAP